MALSIVGNCPPTDTEWTVSHNTIPLTVLFETTVLINAGYRTCNELGIVGVDLERLSSHRVRSGLEDEGARHMHAVLDQLQQDRKHFEHRITCWFETTGGKAVICDLTWLSIRHFLLGLLEKQDDVSVRARVRVETRAWDKAPGVRSDRQRVV